MLAHRTAVTCSHLWIISRFWLIVWWIEWFQIQINLCMCIWFIMLYTTIFPFTILLAFSECTLAFRKIMSTRPIRSCAKPIEVEFATWSSFGPVWGCIINQFGYVFVRAFRFFSTRFFPNAFSIYFTFQVRWPGFMDPFWIVRILGLSYSLTMRIIFQILILSHHQTNYV